MKKIKALSLGVLLSLGAEMNIWASAAGGDMDPRLQDRRQTGFAMAQIWGSMGTWRQQNQEIAAIMTVAPILEPFRTAFERFNLQELNGIRFLLTEGVADDLRPELARVLRDLSIDRLQAIAAHARALFTRAMTPDGRARIIAVLAPLSGDQINAIGEIIIRLFPYGMDYGGSPREVINALTPLNIDTLHAIGAIAERLITDDMDSRDRGAIIEVLRPFNADQIHAIGAHARALFEGRIFSDRLWIIRAFAGVHAAQIGPRIQAILEYVPALFQGEDGDGGSPIIIAFAGVDADQIGPRAEAIRTHVPELFRKDMDQFHREEIISAFARVDTAQIGPRIQAVATHVPALFADDTNGDEKARIISAFAGVHAAQIGPRVQAILYHATELFEGVDRYNKPTIIRAFAGVDADQIGPRVQSILDHATEFFEGADRYDKPKIIMALVRLSVDHINTIAMHNTALFRDDTNGYNKAKIISAFAGVHAAQIGPRIQAILEYVPALLGRDSYYRFVHEDNRSTIIEAFARVDTAQIGPRVQAILDQIPTLYTNDNMHGGYNKATIIRELATLNVEQIEEIVSQFIASTRLNADSDLDQILAFIKRVASQAAVPSGGAGGAGGPGGAGAPAGAGSGGAFGGVSAPASGGAVTLSDRDHALQNLREHLSSLDEAYVQTNFHGLIREWIESSPDNPDLKRMLREYMDINDGIFAAQILALRQDQDADRAEEMDEMRKEMRAMRAGEVLTDEERTDLGRRAAKRAAAQAAARKATHDAAMRERYK